MKQFIKKLIAKMLGKKKYLLLIPRGTLLLNFIVQRIFRVNSHVNCSVHFTSRVHGFNNIKITGSKDSILTSMAASGACYINIFDGTKLKIGENTIWAYGVTIITGNHGLLDRQNYTYGDIEIGNNCWLAAKVTMLPNSKIGNNVTVAANSVVTKQFPDNVVIGGIPAKILKHID